MDEATTYLLSLKQVQSILYILQLVHSHLPPLTGLQKWGNTQNYGHNDVMMMSELICNGKWIAAKWPVYHTHHRTRIATCDAGTDCLRS